MKLRFPRSPLGRHTFADVLHGEGDSSGLLLLWIGDQLPELEYAARAGDEPADLVDLLAASDYTGPALALLSPPELPWIPGQAYLPFVEHVREELIPGTGTSPTSLAVIGYGFGAALAVLLAREPALPVRALCALAPVGAHEAAALSREGLQPLSCPVHVATNVDDPYHPHARQLAIRAATDGTRPTMLIGTGGHELAAYARNGLAEKSVRFAAARLAGYR